MVDVGRKFSSTLQCSRFEGGSVAYVFLLVVLLRTGRWGKPKGLLSGTRCAVDEAAGISLRIRKSYQNVHTLSYRSLPDSGQICVLLGLVSHLRTAGPVCFRSGCSSLARALPCANA
jgi:hypothetical protein